MKRALLLLAIFSAACNRTPPSPPAEDSPTKAVVVKPDGAIALDATAQKTAGIEIAAVESKTIALAITATGQFVFNEERTWVAGALTDGRIESVYSKVGDQVKAGQILARLHSHEVHDARAAYRSAEQDVTRAQSAEALAIRQRDRAQRLFALTAISREHLENAEQEVRSAESAMRNAKIAFERARTHMVDFLDVAPESDEHDVPVRAPELGVVVERKASPGMVASAGQDLFRLTDPRSLWLIAAVNESDLPSLRIGQTVRITVRAYEDRTFTGRIERLGEELDPETRTLKVRVLVPNPESLLKPGMFASVNVQRESSRAALFTQGSAVQDVNGQASVFVRTGTETFAIRPVLLGQSRDGEVEVTSGLKAGEQVVTKGSFILKSQLLRGTLADE